MSIPALTLAIPPGEKLLLDTNVLIAYLEGRQDITGAATLVIDDWIRHGRNQAFVAMVSVMELLVGPLRAGQSSSDLTDFLQHYPNLTCVPLDFSAAQTAAALRARTSLRTPDALIIGTAIAAGADRIVTNDNAWSTISPKPVVTLSTYI